MNKITLIKYGLEPNIVIEDGVFTLVVENKALLFDILTELRNQIINGEEGSFNLLFGNKNIGLEKSASAVFDITNIEFNSKPITNLLSKKFCEFLSLGEQTQNLVDLESVILNLVENFRIKSGFNIEYNATASGSNIAKICNLKIADNGETITERLCEYVSLLCELQPLRLFVLVFAKEFLTDKQILAFHKFCQDKDIKLLIIEGNDKTNLIEDERRLIIDNDLCTIILGYNEDF